jgi:two-component system, OmpR family, sensor kinase
MSLRARIVLALLYLLALAVVALAVPLALNVERRARSDFEARLGDQAQVIAASLSDAVTREDARQALAPIVREYGRELGGRVIVTDGSGTLLADSTRTPAPAEQYASRPEVARALSGERVRLERNSEELGGRFLFLAVPVLDGDEVAGVVRVSQATEEIDDRVRRSWVAFAGVGLLILLVGSIVAWALGSSLARPLRGLAASAGRLGSGDLTARAPVEGAPEVRDVGVALNRMAADLDALLESQRDFVANASHQLRTPLTGLRLRLEALMSEPGARAEAEAALREVDRLGRLIDDLLRLARASLHEPTGRPVDLAEQVREAGERWGLRAEEAGHRLDVRADGATALADAADVASALDNLIENALTYTPGGTRVLVESLARDGAAAVAVEDDGPGIPSEEVPRVVERFYRGHGTQAPGTGLGLAIVKEIAERWGGELDVNGGEGGTRVVVRFPAVS